MWTLRQAQMDALADDTFERVLARVARNASLAYPEVPLAFEEGRYVPWVRELLEAAVALDITHEENLQRFVDWHCLVGPASSVAEEFPWAMDMLRAEGEREGDRVGAVELRMQGLDDGDDEEG